MATTTFEHLIHLIALCYIIPTFILYFITLYTIFFSSVKKQYISLPFYWLFGFSAIIYMIHTISYFFIFRLTKIPLLYDYLKTWPNESFFYFMFYTLLFYTLCATPFYNVAIAFNRFTIFLLKTRYNNFWKKYLKFILIFCVLGPLTIVIHFPFLEIKNQQNILGGNTLLSISPTFPNLIPWWEPSRNAFIIISISSILSLAMTLYVIYSIFKLRYFNKANNNGNMIHFSSQDSAMFAYSVLIFLTEILVSVRQLMLTINRTKFLTFALDIQYIAVDVSDLIPVWFVLATNRDLRNHVIKAIWKLLCLKKFAFVNNTTSQQRRNITFPAIT